MAKKRVRCHYCDRPAACLCDFVLDTRSADSPVTCDRPLCASHRTRGGVRFFCGEAGEAQEVDFCPGHAKGPPMKPRYVPIGGPKGA